MTATNSDSLSATNTVDNTKSSSIRQNIHHFIENTRLSDDNNAKTRSGDMENDLDHLYNADQLNEFNLNLPVANDSGGENEEEEEGRIYHKNVRYMPNKNFNDSLPNSIPNTFKYKSNPNAKTKVTLGASNELTKQEISKQIDQLIENKDNGSNNNEITPSSPLKTSTINKQMEEGTDKTPDWMPSELNERWTEPNSISLNQKPSLNFQLPSTNNSIIHNSRSKQTPDWKKIKKNYDEQKKVNLQQIFVDRLDNNFNSLSSTLSTPYNSIKPNQITKEQLLQLSEKDKQQVVQDKTIKKDLNIDNVSPLKLFGPDYNTFTSDKLKELLFVIKPPPKFNLNNLQNNKILEEEEHVDDQEAAEESEGVKSGPETQKQQAQFEEDVNEEQDTSKPTNQDSYTFSSTEDKENSSFSVNPMPKLKTKKFENDIESKFRMKANDIFDNIQKRGNFLKASNNFSNSINGNSIATATSTPKFTKVKDFTFDSTKYNEHSNASNHQDYGSFTSGFNEDTTQFQEVNKDVLNSNDYTSFSSSNSNISNTSDNSNIENKLANSFTFERISDSNSVSTNSGSKSTLPNEQVNEYTASVSNTVISSSTNPRLSDSSQDLLVNKIRYLEEQLSSLNVLKDDIKNLANENTKLKEKLSYLDIDKYDDTKLTNDPQSIDFKMKRVSQLKLQQERGTNKTKVEVNAPNKYPQLFVKPALNQNTPSKGHLNPASLDLPMTYENMIFDQANHRWIKRNNTSNDNSNELDEIESLLDEEEEKESIGYENAEDDIVRKEVSFQLPHTDQVKSSPMNLNSVSSSSVDTDSNMNVTKVDEIKELSFSEHQKNLVSIITDTLIDKEQDWNLVSEISFYGLGINNIKDLNIFLPGLKKLDLSSNNLKFLTGLPINLINLDLLNNMVSNLTNFKKLVNLQSLNVFNNQLNDCKNLRYNIHLTRLNLSNNAITSLHGLNNLTNLIYLDVSGNLLSGKIDFNDFSFDNLQDLNLSENSIEIVENLQLMENLRILNINENKLKKISNTSNHRQLKKLLVKFNQLSEIDLKEFAHLRVLRFEGNSPHLTLNGLENLKYLEEISSKCFNNQRELQKFNEQNMQSLKILDISGIKNIFNILQPRDQFINVNKLSLVSLNLVELPKHFNDVFPNLIEINLNFNKLKSLDKLGFYKNLKKLSIVSNELSKIENLITSLKNSRHSIRFLDIRLNSINRHFYPYLFNPNEVDIPIELDELDDIENFNILYHLLMNLNFSEVNMNHNHKLSEEQLDKKISYLTLLINYFPNLKKLDGAGIDLETKLEFSRMI